MAVHDDSAAPDFTAMYRELGVDATCSLADLRTAWRRRVSQLHPDQGGSAEDTGRLQELNRRYDAALEFHARFGRLPGASVPGIRSAPSGESMSDTAADAGWRRADAAREAQGAAGFGTIARYFVAMSAIAVILLIWRSFDRGNAATDDGSDVLPDQTNAQAVASAGATLSNDRGRRAGAAIAPDAIAPGIDKDTVRHILGEPLDMHPLRWHYGPSWVDFRCDRVAGWYSSPLRPLRTGTTRLEAPSATETRCD